MTSRPKEPYSLIRLDAIKGTINYITDELNINTNTVFRNFESKFIKDREDGGNIFENPPENVPNMYSNPKAIGFFDSLHDFKSDFMDCQGNIKGSDNFYSYKKFGFSFLLNGGYPNFINDENLIFSLFLYLFKKFILDLIILLLVLKNLFYTSMNSF